MTLPTRTVLNLVLLAVVAGLALMAIYEPGIEEAAPPDTLTELDPNTITRIRIQHRDGEAILLEKQDTGWRMLEPLAVAANEYRAKAVTRLAEVEIHGRLKAADLDLSQFKLDEPQIRVWLNDVELDFGGTDPINARRYVLKGDTVFLADDRLQHHLTAPYPDFVSTALLPSGANPVAFELPALTLRRGKDLGWSVEPEHPGATTDALLALVDAWRHATALWVKQYEGDTAPEGTITIRLEGETQPVRFEIVGREPELILARPALGLQYHLPQDATERLLQLPEPEKPGDEGDDGEAPGAPAAPQPPTQ